MDQPSIDAFFTCNNKPIYAILPRWQVGGFTLEGIDAQSVKSVVLLGDNRPLAFHGAADGTSVDLPVISGTPPGATSVGSEVLPVAQRAGLL